MSLIGRIAKNLPLNQKWISFLGLMWTMMFDPWDRSNQKRQPSGISSCFRHKMSLVKLNFRIFFTCHSARFSRTGSIGLFLVHWFDFQFSAVTLWSLEQSFFSQITPDSRMLQIHPGPLRLHSAAHLGKNHRPVWDSFFTFCPFLLTWSIRLSKLT